MSIKPFIDPGNTRGRTLLRGRLTLCLANLRPASGLNSPVNSRIYDILKCYRKITDAYRYIIGRNRNMVKYFINLSKIKEYAKEFMKKPCKKNRPLIAAVGTEKEPVYLFFLDSMYMIDGFKITIENAEDEIVEEYIYLSSDDWISTIKRFVEKYNKDFESEEEFEDVCTAICQNPECVEYGNKVDIISDAMGRTVCPNCGEVIEDTALTESPEEDDFEEDDLEELDRERLLEIAYNLILSFLYESNVGYNLELLEALDIELDEISSIEVEYLGECANESN